MLTLKCLATGSKGNCYLLSADTDTLILDCGIPMRDIKRGLGYDLQKVVGVVCSHEHLDHSKALDDFHNMGIHIMAPFEAGDVKRSHCRMGSFDITSFDLPHNGVCNSGFMIAVDSQKILYLTDFEYCPYVFKRQKINHILIECNYQKEYVDKDAANYTHKIAGHCSLDTCKTFIEANRTDALRTVLLCHMGRDTLDVDEAVAEVKEVAGNAAVDYCRAGETYQLEKGGRSF